MQFQLFTIAFAALAAAAPGSAPSYGSGSGSGSGDSGSLTPPKAGSVDVCTNGWTPQCCATNVLGVAGLDCSQVPDTIKSKDNFEGQCSDEGLSANCCLIPVLGQGLVCQSV